MLARFHTPFYNVSGKVGPTSAEFRTDVLLVQYFLFFIMWLKNTTAFDDLASVDDLPAEVKKDITSVSFN